MSGRELITPIRAEDITGLKTGDTVYLTGTLVTGRDDVHIRAVRQNQPLPVQLSGMALFHAGPIMREKEGAPGEYEVMAIGPTTSMRMEGLEAAFIEKTGVKLIIGKGGMGPATAAACKTHKALHAVYPGGCAVLAAEQVKRVTGVHWKDLGMPEAMWVLEVERFGPLIVSIDTEGNNLFEANKKTFAARKEQALEEVLADLEFLE